VKLRTHRLVVGLIAAGLLALCAGIAFAVSASEVQSRFRAKVDEDWYAKNLRITVVPYDSQARTDRGQFAKVFLAADAAQHKTKGIRVVELSIAATDVDIDVAALVQHHKVVVQSRKLGSCHVKLLEDDVNKLLSMKKTPIENLRADFGNGTITFTGKYKFNIKLTGTLEVHNGYEIWFKPTQASVGVLGIPVGIVNQFLAKMNPIIDMREVPLQPMVKVINIRPDSIGFAG
jgi:hypothetical protein